MDACALQNSSMIMDKVPLEIFDEVRGQLVGGSITAKNANVMNARDQTALIDRLERQIYKLYDAVENLNVFFWTALEEPGEHLTAQPEAYGMGDVEQMQISLQHNYDAWHETPGAIEALKSLIEEK